MMTSTLTQSSPLDRSIESIRKTLIHSADTKCRLAADVPLERIGEKAISILQKTARDGGTIRIYADRDSRWSANHLHQELVLQFKSGAILLRNDRSAIPAIQYCEYPTVALANLISNKFNPKKDALIVFGATEPSSDLNAVLEVSSVSKIPTILISPANIRGGRDSILHFNLNTFSLPVVQSLHRTILHSFCEGLEPEYRKKGPMSLPNLLRGSSDVDRALMTSRTLLKTIAEAKSSIQVACDSEKVIYLCGNGGSTCEANELRDRLRANINNKGHYIEAHSLHSSGILANSINDGHQPFIRQITALGKPGDILIAFTAHGQLKNIAEAASSAKSLDMVTIGLCGEDGSGLTEHCSHLIPIPSKDPSRVHEAQAIIGQMLVTSNSHQ